MVVVIQEIVSTTPNRSGGNELQLITKMPMCNIEMGVFMSSFFKVCRQKKPVITNHLDDEGIFFEILGYFLSLSISVSSKFRTKL